ncbi:hypothetical protein [Streptomyces cirratus]|uniref:hypothetical protein n=1 Tax=Streptomyces cirratus TaxID=68187 RepID=UPI00360CCCB1
MNHDRSQLKIYFRYRLVSMSGHLARRPGAAAAGSAALDALRAAAKVLGDRSRSHGSHGHEAQMDSLDDEIRAAETSLVLRPLRHRTRE